MNELELAQFAAPAAQTLLTAMLTDGWQAVKGRLARIVAGRTGDPQSAEEGLNELHQRVIADSSHEALEQRTSEVFALLCAAISRDPNVVTPLRELIGEVEAGKTSVEAERIHQTATVRDNAVNFQQISGTQNYRTS
ncbi:hypothetical protein ACFV8Z_20200 [Streptomyces sp. NPDC059837]|uniref:hypothetical protein n=1 Tax=Streptomyces sp. NPDC059837 TaxID=3346968 RepID=UPI0036678504